MTTAKLRLNLWVFSNLAALKCVKDESKSAHGKVGKKNHCSKSIYHKYFFPSQNF